MILCAILFLSWLFPKNNFKYDFEQDRPWNYEDLKAPYAFPILKSKEELDKERKDIRINFIDYYRIDTSIQYTNIKKYENDFPNFYQNLSADTTLTYNQSDSIYLYIKGRQLLNQIYEKGIIENGSGRPTKGKIKVILDNLSKTLNYNKLNTRIKAFKFILDSNETDPKIQSKYLTSFLENYVQANVFSDDEMTAKFLTEELDAILPIRDKVQDGEKIVSNGQLVDETIYRKLISLKNSYSEAKEGISSELITFIGYFIIIGMMLYVLLTLNNLFSKTNVNNLRTLTFILLILVSFSVIVKSVSNFAEPTLVYAIPFCIVPIVLRAFLGNMLALFAYFVLLLFTNFILPGKFDFILIQFLAGTVALLTNINTSRWSQFFSSVSIIFVVYCMAYLGLHFIKSGNFQKLELGIAGSFFLSSLLTLVAYPLIPLFERIFGFISNLSLSELNNVNHPLLKNLSTKAPGSFWHSIQVASLAEQAAINIGANETLAKVGALYHDIGKTKRPIYFIENQNSEINPHDELDPLESAKIIIDHVTIGIDMAKKYKLPNIIIDFIRTHHGTTKVGYFYKQYLNQNPDKIIDERLFRYPGLLPYSKETAIVMIADSVEAASMSLSAPSDEQINDLVDKIIEGKIKEKQFDNCNLSFKDIKTISKTFKKNLKSKYHIRISY